MLRIYRKERKYGNVDWINLAQAGNYLRDTAGMVMKFSLPQKVGKFLISDKLLTFLKRLISMENVHTCFPGTNVQHFNQFMNLRLEYF
jgi:hypothetical protein